MVRASVLVLLLGVIGAAQAGAQTVRIASGEYPPWSGERLPGGGIATSLTREIFDRAGYEIEFVWLDDWTEVENGVVEGRFDGAIPYRYTLDRSLMVEFSNAFIALRTLPFYNTTSGLEPTGIENLFDRRVCVPRGFAVPAQLTQLFAERRATRVAPETMAACFRLLAENELDVVVAGDQVKRSLERENPEVFTNIAPAPFVLSENTNHVIFSRKVPRAAAVLADFNAALDDLIEDNAYADAFESDFDDFDPQPLDVRDFRELAALVSPPRRVILKDGVERQGRVVEKVENRDSIYEVQTEFGAIQYPRELIREFRLISATDEDVENLSPMLRVWAPPYLADTLGRGVATAFLAARFGPEIAWTDRSDAVVRGDVADPQRKGVAAIDLTAASVPASLAAIATGQADVALTARPAAPREIARVREAGLGDLRSRTGENVIALEALAIIASPDLNVAAIRLPEFRAALTDAAAPLRLGEDAAPVTLHAPSPANAATHALVSDLLLKDAALHANVATAARDAEILERVATGANAVGVVRYTSAVERPLAVRTACGITTAPSDFNVKTEGYPLTRRIFLYTPPATTNPAIGNFAEFAEHSGARAIPNLGFVGLDILREPERAAPRDAAREGAPNEGGPNEDAPRDGAARDGADAQTLAQYAAFTQDYESLSAVLRFRVGSSDLDGRARRDVRRVADFIRSRQVRPKEIRLVGFADSTGDVAVNQRLSTQRAAAAANAIRRELPDMPASTLGVGEIAPVACNSDEAGRQLNRRVEIWIEKAQ